MELEAILLLGGILLVLGIVLLIPGIIIARKISRKHPDSRASEAVTKAGFLHFGIFIFVMLFGLSAKIWAPDTAFGQWIDTDNNDFIYILVVSVIVVIVEIVFALFGFRVQMSKNNNDF